MNKEDKKELKKNIKTYKKLMKKAKKEYFSDIPISFLSKKRKVSCLDSYFSFLIKQEIINYYGKKLHCEFVIPALDEMSEKGVLAFMRKNIYYDSLGLIYMFELQNNILI